MTAGDRAAFCHVNSGLLVCATVMKHNQGIKQMEEIYHDYQRYTEEDP